MTTGPALLADEMLGKLARELRALGVDAAYAHGTSDEAILERAEAEDRVLVTRDRALADRAGTDAVLVESRDPAEQLDRVVDELGLAPSPADFLSRCLECNVEIEAAEPEAVPEDVREEPCSRCPSCERVYWPGTHARDMLDRLGEHLAGPVDEATALDPTSGGSTGERKP